MFVELPRGGAARRAPPASAANTHYHYSCALRQCVHYANADRLRSVCDGAVLLRNQDLLAASKIQLRRQH